MYFVPGFLWQCRLPAYVLLAKIRSLILLKTGGAEHVPAAEPCSCLLLEMLKPTELGCLGHGQGVKNSWVCSPLLQRALPASQQP